MTIETAIQQIKQFWKSDQPLPFGQSDNTIHIGRLTKEFSTNLPDDAKNYIQSFAPLQDFFILTRSVILFVFTVLIILGTSRTGTTLTLSQILL